MSSIRQHPRNLLTVTDNSGNVTEIPGFTCRHCNSSKAPSVVSTRDSTKIGRKIKEWFAAKTVCLQCDALICDLCAAIAQVTIDHHSFETDMERADLDLMKQPWFLRDSDGDPVYRIFSQSDGQVIHVKQRNTGYTQRELERISGDLTLLGTRRTEQDG